MARGGVLAGQTRCEDGRGCPVPLLASPHKEPLESKLINGTHRKGKQDGARGRRIEYRRDDARVVPLVAAELLRVTREEERKMVGHRWLPYPQQRAGSVRLP